MDGSPPGVLMEAEKVLTERLVAVQGALNRLWSNGPAIDTIATLNASWVNPDGDPTLYEQLRDLSQAVDAAVAEATR